MDEDDAGFRGGDDRLWHSGIGTAYPESLKKIKKKDVSIKYKGEEEDEHEVLEGIRQSW